MTRVSKNVAMSRSHKLTTLASNTTQDSIEQARGRSHEEDSSQIFMLDDMQFGGGFGCYLG
jgi:hypothetical protein